MKVQSSRAIAGYALLILLVWMAGCSSQPQPVDLRAARSSLLESDMAWSKTPPDADAFVAVMDETASFLTPDAPQADGPEEIKAAISEFFKAPGFALSWKAESAEVASSGDLGYTLGTFELTLNDADGNPLTRKGKYATIWKKGEDGKWKVVADIPNFDSPPPTPVVDEDDMGE